MYGPKIYWQINMVNQMKTNLKFQFDRKLRKNISEHNKATFLAQTSTINTMISPQSECVLRNQISNKKLSI